MVIEDHTDFFHMYLFVSSLKRLMTWWCCGRGLSLQFLAFRPGLVLLLPQSLSTHMCKWIPETGR